MTAPVRWSGLEDEAPELAAAGRELLYQFGPGLGYLATLRGDGAPRLHPVCPVVAASGLPALARELTIRPGHHW